MRSGKRGSRRGTSAAGKEEKRVPPIHYYNVSPPHRREPLKVSVMKIIFLAR